MNTQMIPLDDDHAASDQQSAALTYFTEAFAEAIHDGIEGDCFAQAAVCASFRELVALYGEEAVARYVEKIPSRIREGAFTVASRH